MNRFILSAVTIALALPLAAMAGQGNDPDRDCVSIQTADFDPADASSQEMMYARLKDVVEDVCGATDIRNAGSLLQAMNNRQCTEDKLVLAVGDFDSDGMRSLYESDQQEPFSTGR